MATAEKRAVPTGDDNPASLKKKNPMDIVECFERDYKIVQDIVAWMQSDEVQKEEMVHFSDLKVPDLTLSSGLVGDLEKPFSVGVHTGPDIAYVDAALLSEFSESIYINEVINMECHKVAHLEIALEYFSKRFWRYADEELRDDVMEGLAILVILAKCAKAFVMMMMGCKYTVVWQNDGRDRKISPDSDLIEAQYAIMEKGATRKFTPCQKEHVVRLETYKYTNHGRATVYDAKGKYVSVYCRTFMMTRAELWTEEHYDDMKNAARIMEYTWDKRMGQLLCSE